MKYVFVLKRVELEEKCRRQLKQKEQEHMSALSQCDSDHQMTATELDRARNETKQVAGNLESEKRHSEALSVQLETVGQELTECKKQLQDRQV